MAARTRSRGSATLADRPATVVAGLLALVVGASALLTPTNVLLVLAPWGLCFGVAYFVDAYGWVLEDATWRRVRERLTLAERGLGAALLVTLLAGGLGWPVRAPLVSVVGTAVGGLAALVLTAVCWRQQSRSRTDGPSSRAVR